MEHKKHKTWIAKKVLKDITSATPTKASQNGALSARGLQKPVPPKSSLLVAAKKENLSRWNGTTKKEKWAATAVTKVSARVAIV